MVVVLVVVVGVVNVVDELMLTVVMNHPCGENQTCADLPAPAPDDAAGRTCSCNPGFGDCNGNPSDGCEVDLATDFHSCGACGAYCVGTYQNGACVDGCGSGACNGGKTCVNCAADCGTCGSPFCDGSASAWAACRGSGCTVCAERLDVSVYAKYFVHHPACMINNVCHNEFYLCSDACPAPTDADR